MKDRASILIRNRTNYFDPNKDKAFIQLSNPNSYKFNCSKQMGYKLRLYYEYKETERLHGQTFFYTLTYNDAHLPVDPFLHEPSFDYLDLAVFLNGGFKKKLERKYFLTYKYFVGAELGEGKGKRGISNNPHYHILFFLTPLVPGAYISPAEFRHLIRLYWQGADQDERWISYNKFKLGLAKEGRFNLGEVVDFRACLYASKYVTKDLSLRKREKRIESFLFDKYSAEGLSPNEIDLKINEDIKLYRNRYCNKVRISQGVGLSGLDSISNVLNPYLPLPSDDGFIYCRPSLFYYRKLYTDVKKDKVTGNNVYVLNDLGIELKMRQLDDNLNNLRIRTRSNLSVLDKKVFDDMLSSPLNPSFTISYEKFKAFDFSDDIIDRYAKYKLIYEHRFYNDRQDSVGSVFDVDYHSDYLRFLQPSFNYVDYDSMRLTRFLENTPKGFYSYDSHPYFYRYIFLFRFLDMLADYLFVKEDISKENDEKERREIKRFHDGIEIDNYINKLI